MSSDGWATELSARVEEDAFGAMFDPHSTVDAMRLGWLQDYAAPSNFVEPLFTCKANQEGGVNVSQFCDPRLDALVSRARATKNASATAEAWARIDRLLVDEAPAVPLYALREADFVSKRVGNYTLQSPVRRAARPDVGAVSRSASRREVEGQSVEPSSASVRSTYARVKKSKWW